MSRSRTFNRTSMELKPRSAILLSRLGGSFNRTSMELKRVAVSCCDVGTGPPLLIEPVWN